MKTKSYFILVVLLAINLLGCSTIGETEEHIVSRNSLNDNKEITYAAELVKRFSRIVNTPNKTTKSSPDINLILEKTKTLKFNLSETKSNITSDSVNLYTFIIKTDENTGFAIVSGDERVGQVYAYVENGSLADTANIKGMAYMISAIPEICKRDFYKYMENNISTKAIDDGYFDTSEFNGNLIKTEWSQDIPYNWGTPSSACGGYYYAGCGVIAVAQVVAYYKKCDRVFDFNALTTTSKIEINSSSYLTNEVSCFIAYLGKKCNAEYGCEETITYMDSGCMSALTSFGFSHTYSVGSLYRDQDDYTKVENCINSGNVIIGFGQDTKGKGGHFWIIDGFLPIMCRCYDSNKIHCNWGWGGTANGWYTDLGSEDIFTHPEGQPYNFASELYYYYLDVK